LGSANSSRVTAWEGSLPQVEFLAAADFDLEMLESQRQIAA